MSRSYVHACATWIEPPGTWTREDGWLEGLLESKDCQSRKLVGVEMLSESKARRTERFVWVEGSSKSKAHWSWSILRVEVFTYSWGSISIIKCLIIILFYFFVPFFYLLISTQEDIIIFEFFITHHLLILYTFFVYVTSKLNTFYLHACWTLSSLGFSIDILPNLSSTMISSFRLSLGILDIFFQIKYPPLFLWHAHSHHMSRNRVTQTCSWLTEWHVHSQLVMWLTSFVIGRGERERERR